MAMASDSSLDSADLDGRHSCPNCNARMSSLIYDRHKCCLTCCGQDCTLDHKCVECSLWPSDVFDKFVKHCRSLVSKSRSKKLRKDSSGAVPCKSSVVEGQGDQGSVNNSIPTSGISEDRVKSLILAYNTCTSDISPGPKIPRHSCTTFFPPNTGKKCSLLVSCV